MTLRDLENVYAKCAYEKRAEVLPLARELRLGVELFFADSTPLYPQNTFSFSELPEKTIAHLPFSGLCLGAADKNIGELSLQILQSSLRVLGSVGIKCGVFHPAFSPLTPKGKREQVYELTKKRLACLLSFAEKQNFTLLAENTWEEDPIFFDRLQNDFPALAFCFDYGHAHCFSQVAPQLWLSTLQERIKHVHLSDNCGTEDDHLPLGQGKVSNYALLPSGLTYTLEVEPSAIKTSYLYLQEVL